MQFILQTISRIIVFYKTCWTWNIQMWKKLEMLRQEFAVVQSQNNSTSEYSRINVKFRRKLPISSNIACAQLQKISTENVLQGEHHSWNQLSSYLSRLLRTLQFSCGRLKLTSFRKNSFIFISLLLILFTNLISPTTAKNFKSRSSDYSRTLRRAEHFRRRNNAQCERISIPICVDIGYNFTDISLSPSNMLEQEETAIAVSDTILCVHVNWLNYHAELYFLN